MTPTELQQFLRDKLRKAYSFGQTYWQQADSEYRRENKKADETAAKFAELVENVVLAVKFEMDRAATEAAKATGTAGEMPPLPEGKLYDTPAGPMHRYTINQMREYGGKCADAARNLAIEQAEAARQPAPVLPVKTWQERMGKSGPPITAMQAEIAELRAALAATAAPVLSDEQRKKLEYIANWMDSSVRIIQNAPDDYGPASQFDYDMGEAAHEILTILAATKGQP